MSEKSEQQPTTGPKAVLVGRAQDVSPFMDRDETRETLANVRIDAERRFVEATDGRILARVPLPDLDPMDYPPDEGGISQGKEPLGTTTLVPLKDWQSMVKRLPATTKRVPIEILRRALVSRQGEGKLAIFSTDLDSPQLASVKEPPDVKWPNTDNVMEGPDAKAPPKARVLLGAEYLAKIADYAKRVAEGSVELLVGDPMEMTRWRIPTEDGTAEIGYIPRLDEKTPMRWLVRDAKGNEAVIDGPSAWRAVQDSGLTGELRVWPEIDRNREESTWSTEGRVFEIGGGQ